MLLSEESPTRRAAFLVPGLISGPASETLDVLSRDVVLSRDMILSQGHGPKPGCEWPLSGSVSADHGSALVVF